MTKRAHDEIDNEQAPFDPGATDVSGEGSSSEGEGINRADFGAATSELHNTMEQHGVSGYGNVINLKEAVLARLDATGKTLVTLQLLNNLVQQGIKGAPRGKRVHEWFKEIVEHGHCSYVEHVKSKHARGRP